MGRGVFSNDDFFKPKSNAVSFRPTVWRIKSHNSSDGGLIGWLVLIIIIKTNYTPFVNILKIKVREYENFFNKIKVIFLGIKNTL